MIASLRAWLGSLSRDRERRAGALVSLAILVGAIARLWTAHWGLPFRYHVDELGFVMWVAAHAEWSGFVHGSFEPTVTTYGPLVYELAIAVKWLVSGTHDAALAARTVGDGWAYLTLLEDPARTPLTLTAWIAVMRDVSAGIGVLTVLVLARATRRLAGPEAAAIVAWLAALAPGLVQVSHFYTPDGLLLFFEVLVLDAASLLIERPSAARASYAGLAVGLVLATKMTGGLVALLVPWALFVRRVDGPDVTSVGALARACASRFTWVAALASVLVYAAFCPWPFMRGPSYFTEGGGPTSGAFMLRTLYERDFGFYDWRFAYLDATRGASFLTSLVPYAIGLPATIAALAGLAVAERRTRLVALGLLLPTSALVAGWSVITIRYALPLLPPLLLAAAAGLARLASRSRTACAPRSARHARAAAALVIALVLVPSLARGLAWTLMFSEEDPRTLASRWIGEHARDGDVVVVENEPPYTAPFGHADPYRGELPFAMPRVRVERLFDGNELGDAVPPHLARRLSNARYLVVSRWMASRAETHAALERAPLHARFYRALFAGETGFAPVARFERHPTLGPLAWREDDEEQLAVCFDHCPITIFERVGDYRSPFDAPASALPHE